MDGIICYNTDGEALESLYQWDSNQTIVVSGVDTEPAPVFHFCNRLSKTALVVTPTLSDGRLVASIPNILLQKPDTILVYLFVEGGENGNQTICVARIPVIPRPRPDDYVFEENIDPSGWQSRLGGMSFKMISRQDFDLLDPKNFETAYFVTNNDGSISLYLGYIEVSGAETNSNTSATYVATSYASTRADIAAIGQIVDVRSVEEV